MKVISDIYPTWGAHADSKALGRTKTRARYSNFNEQYYRSLDDMVKIKLRNGACNLNRGVFLAS